MEEVRVDENDRIQEKLPKGLLQLPCSREKLLKENKTVDILPEPTSRKE